MITLKEYLELDHRCPWYTKYYEELGLPDTRREEDKTLIVEYNKALIEKYPWLLPRNRWTGKVSPEFNYSHTELDSMPEGWRIAFGEQMCEEIQQVLLHAQELDPETNYVDNFRILDIKEKYGTLRFYCGSAPEEVYNIINKYEKLSESVCIRCGKQPTKWMTQWWISFYCEDCKNELEANEDFRDSFILIEEDK